MCDFRIFELHITLCFNDFRETCFTFFPYVTLLQNTVNNRNPCVVIPALSWATFYDRSFTMIPTHNTHKQLRAMNATVCEGSYETHSSN